MGNPVRLKRRTIIQSGAALGASLLGGARAQAGVEGSAQADAGRAFSVPAEEAPHDWTFMQWPVHRKVYRDPAHLVDVQATIAKIANTIAEHEPVVMLAAKDHHALARALLSEAVALWDVPTDDLWCRDSGPLIALGEGKRVVSHIAFNGWGSKQIHANDAEIARQIATRLNIPLVPSGLVGEAGGVEHDGAGLLIAHESSWVTKDRNPGRTRAEIEAALLQAYGARQMIWAKGVQGLDITDYHIDSLARLNAPGRALINLPQKPDRRDPFHRAALQTEAILRDAGLAVEVIEEPASRRINDPEFVASYVNYYICNGAIITAEFGDERADALAIDALKRHFPNRDIRALNVDVLGELGGGIHCATQQMPAI